MGVFVCRSWRVALVAAALGLGTVALADRADGAGVTFGGLSSQDRPIVVEVTPRRARVARVLWDWEAKCVLGPAGTPATSLTKRASDRTTPQQFPVNRLGRWSGKYTAGPFPQTATGLSETYEYTLRGRFLARGTRMAGTIRVTYVETDAATAIVRTCRTGLITFNIKD